ncbi:MAG: radical SAM protein [Spirochaetota bacterium]
MAGVKHEVLGLDFAGFEALVVTLPSGRGVAGKVYARAFECGRLDFEGLGLAARSVAAYENAFGVSLLEVRRTVEEEGEFGATVKAVMACRDGAEVECVLIPMPPRADGHKRATICLSSQVGCRMACSFCETGHGGLLRDLEAAEIVAQLVTARVRLGWESGNVVFMGMGEPLDNLENLLAALKVLTERRGLGISWERITVCTSGIVPGIEALRERGHRRLNLSLSLNAADDETRSRLMPVNRRWSLASLAIALAAYPGRRNFVLALNWCLLPGINDGPADARAAAAFVSSLRRGEGRPRALFNLIPYNPGSRPLARAPSDAEVAAFAALLEAEGCQVRTRSRKGSLIMAACGQLGAARFLPSALSDRSGTGPSPPAAEMKGPAS